MALEGKAIKEEIPDKDLYEANLIRAKGELITRTEYKYNVCVTDFKFPL